MPWGLLLLRLAVGGLLAGHGAQQLFGWFGGPGLTGTANFFGRLGWRPATLFAVLGGMANLASGLLLLTGLLPAVAAALTTTMMGNAILAVHRPNGLWNQRGGYEFPLTLAVVAVSLAATGPGRYSLATLLGGSQLWGPRAALAAVLAGLLAVLAGQRLRHPTPEPGKVQPSR